MSFGAELKDFVAAFQTGSEIVGSAQDRQLRAKEQASQAKLRDAQTRALEADLTPEAIAAEQEERAANLAHTRATTAHTQAATADLTDPEKKRLRALETESEIGAREAAADLNRANTGLIKEELAKKKRQRTMLRGLYEKRGLEVPDYLQEEPASAVPASPQSSVGTTSDPVALNQLEPHQAAMLNAIALGESGGAYNVRYTPEGAATFDDFSQHPAIYEQGPHGPSSAAGRYQFVKSTWDDLGGGEFSPEMQDLRAWELASKDYTARTGKDLDAELRTNGLTPEIIETLEPTWKAFGKTPERYMQAYSDSLARYSEGQQAIDSMIGGGGGDINLAHKGRDAAVEGLRYAMSALGADKRTAVPTDDRKRAQVALLQGEGAASPEEVEQVENTVKELAGGEELSEAEMVLYSLALTREMYLMEEDPEAAQRAAASLLQYYRQAASQYIAVAKAAAQDGNVDGATKAIAHAYANVPDGREAKFETQEDGKIAVTFTDIDTGREVRKEVVTPDEMFAHIMQLTPGTIEQNLLRAAGEDYTPPKRLSPALEAAVPEVAGMEGTDEANLYFRAQEAKKADPLSVSERAAIDEEIQGAFVQTLEAMTPEGGEPPPIPASEALELQSIAQDVFKVNEVAATDAVRAALSLTSVDPANPQARNFAVQEMEDGSGFVVKFKNGMTINMPQETFARVATMRELRAQQAQAELEERNKPGFMERWFRDSQQGAVPAAPPTTAAPAIPAPRRRPPVTGLPPAFNWNPDAVGGRGVR